MSLKEDFIKFVKERKHKKEIHQFERELKRDKKKVQELLDNFHFTVVGKNGNIEIARVIQGHNFEYCFFPHIWNHLDKAHKMAVMVKFSQKYTPDFPLTLDDFYVQEWAISENEPLISYNSIGECFMVAYNNPKININADVLNDLLSYRDKAKEDIFKRKIAEGLDLSEIKGVWQLRYFFEKREHELMSQYPEIMNDKSLDIEDVKLGIKWDSVFMQFESRLNEKILNIFEKADYFMPDFPGFVDRFKNLNEAFYAPYKEAAEKYFGSLKDRDIKFLKSFNEEYCGGKHDIDELIKMFNPGKRPDTFEDMFDNIELPKGKGLTF